MYIGVLAKTSAQFHIVVRNSKTITVLRDGFTHYSRIKKRRYAYFAFPVGADDAGKEVSFHVTNFGKGDPDIYVSTSVDRPEKGGNGTPNLYSWSSVAGGQSDSVSIASDDPLSCGKQLARSTAGQQCTYFISVYAFTPGLFSIIASYDAVKHLVEGKPQRGYVMQGGGWEFYSFSMPKQYEIEELTVTLTAMAGQASLYVKPGLVTSTKRSDYTYQKEGYNSGSALVLDINKWACIEQVRTVIVSFVYTPWQLKTRYMDTTYLDPTYYGHFIPRSCIEQVRTTTLTRFWQSSLAFAFATYTLTSVNDYLPLPLLPTHSLLLPSVPAVRTPTLFTVRSNTHFCYPSFIILRTEGSWRRHVSQYHLSMITCLCYLLPTDSLF
jgi:hypothetical protein